MFERTRSFIHRLTHSSVWNGEERRLWQRRAAMTTVRIQLDDESEPLTAQVQDVSPGGVRLQVARDIPHGRMLRIDLPESSPGMHTSVLACVVHVRRGGNGLFSVGCQFSTELSDQDMQGLGAPKRRARSTDERHWERVPIAGSAAYRNVRQNGDKRAATLHNISPTGLALLVDEEIQPGNLLQIELLAQGATESLTMLACVVYLTPHGDDRWLIGCNFIRELEDHVLEAFVLAGDRS